MNKQYVHFKVNRELKYNSSSDISTVMGICVGNNNLITLYKNNIFFQATLCFKNCYSIYKLDLKKTETHKIKGGISAQKHLTKQTFDVMELFSLLG